MEAASFHELIRDHFPKDLSVLWNLVTPYMRLEWNNLMLITEIRNINPLTPELNPSAQSCLTSFSLLGILLLDPYISIIQYMSKNPTNATIIHSVYYMWMVAPTCFGITSPSSGNAPSAFWEMLSWVAVDTILWMGVFSDMVCVSISVRHAQCH
jgi:hypothetical protein